MKTDLYNKYHLIFILLLLYQTSPSGSIIYTVFPFIFLHILPIHSLNLASRRSQQVPLYFPDPTAWQEAQGLKQRSLTPFYLPPHSKGRWRAQQDGRRRPQKIQKIFDIFSKTAVSRYLYSRRTRKARGFDRSCSIYLPDAHNKWSYGTAESKKGTASLSPPFPER